MIRLKGGIFLLCLETHLTFNCSRNSLIIARFNLKLQQKFFPLFKNALSSSKIAGFARARELQVGWPVVIYQFEILILDIKGNKLDGYKKLRH